MTDAPPLSKRITYRLGGAAAAMRSPDSLVLMTQTLRRIGWLRSSRRELALSASGDPLPWLTYSAVEWLASAVTPELRVFEYGAGHSTLWFAPRVRELVSTEHDPAWHDSVCAEAPASTAISLRETRGDAVHGVEPDEYVGHLREFPRGHFDLILVDGMARADCVTAALERAGPNTAIVLDNADRPKYREAVERLASAEWCEVDFVGFPPGAPFLSCTTVAACEPARWFRRRRLPRDWGADISSSASSVEW